MSVLLTGDVVATTLNMLGSPFSMLDKDRVIIFAEHRGYRIVNCTEDGPINSFVAWPSDISLLHNTIGTVVYINTESDSFSAAPSKRIFVGFAEPSTTMAESKQCFTKNDLADYIMQEFRKRTKSSDDFSTHKILVSFLNVLEDDSRIFSCLEDVVSAMVCRAVYPFDNIHGKVVSWLN